MRAKCLFMARIIIAMQGKSTLQAASEPNCRSHYCCNPYVRFEIRKDLPFGGGKEWQAFGGMIGKQYSLHWRYDPL